MGYLRNLHQHYIDMTAHGEFASIFSCIYNNHGFRCLFIADQEEKTLYLSSMGNYSFTIPIIIPDDFYMSKLYIGQYYKSLADYLDIKYNPDNPFVPTEFLDQLDGHFPARIIELPSVQERSAIIRRVHKESEGNDYFTGWAKWNVKHTTPENELLTASLIGPAAAKKCRSANISSCWSSDPNQEDLTKLDNWIILNQ